MYGRVSLFIAGEWTEGNARERLPVINPATGDAIGEVPLASHDDLDRALAAAAQGFRRWRAVPAVDRARILVRAARIVEERAAGLSRTMTLEQGKPLAESQGELQRVVETIEWCAEEGKRAYGRVLPARSPGTRHLVVKEPVGPVAAFTPWNFPGVIPARKIAFALAAGCSCIIKASEETPGTCVGLVRAFAEAGIPEGVLNLVFGVPAAVSEHLIRSPVIRKVSFTGSIPVGRRIGALAAEGVKRCTMELGGHAPVVVFDDVDVEDVARTTAMFKFRNAGQACNAPSRFYVHEAVYRPFVEAFVAVARSLRVGNGLDDGVQMGPLANARRLAAMELLTGDAVARGARLAVGGRRLGDGGFFWEPTVIVDVPEDAKVMTEEPFGPVVPIVPFSSLDEVTERANALPYGLAAFAFTRSVRRATAVGEALEAGTIGINHLVPALPEAPFGGVKESGYGSEGGIEGLDAYLNVKYISEMGS